MKSVQKNRLPTVQPTCTKSAALPAWDALGGLTLGVIGGLSIAGSDSSCNSNGECPEVDLEGESKLFGGIMLAGAAVYFISAIIGAEKKHDCVEEFRKFRMQALPPSGTPSGTPSAQ